MSLVVIMTYLYRRAKYDKTFVLFFSFKVILSKSSKKTSLLSELNCLYAFKLELLYCVTKTLSMKLLSSSSDILEMRLQLIYIGILFCSIKLRNKVNNKLVLPLLSCPRRITPVSMFDILHNILELVYLVILRPESKCPRSGNTNMSGRESVAFPGWLKFAPGFKIKDSNLESNTKPFFFFFSGSVRKLSQDSFVC